MVKENLSTIDHLRFLRDEYSDEIPAEIIHSTAPNNRFKVRRAWWAGLLADLEIALEKDIFPDQALQEEIRAFVEYYYHPPNFSDKSLTSAEDIARANSLLNRILGE